MDLLLACLKAFLMGMLSTLGSLCSPRLARRPEGHLGGEQQLPRHVELPPE